MSTQPNSFGTQPPAKANSFRQQPDARGHFGQFGGRYVAETLMPLILELETAYRAAKSDAAFHAEFEDLLEHYVGRPSPLYFAPRLTEALGGAPFEVLATDLDTQVLATAREGVYPLQSVQRLDEARQKRFFLRGTGRFEGRARARRELASHVEFARVNLMDPEWPVAGGLDAIFCRNVMIYFDKPTQARLIERYAALLQPHGLFFAGHAESLLDNGRHFRLKGQTVYELANRTLTRPSIRTPQQVGDPGGEGIST